MILNGCLATRCLSDFRSILTVVHGLVNVPAYVVPAGVLTSDVSGGETGTYFWRDGDWYWQCWLM